jgi:hypothetical protein
VRFFGGLATDREVFRASLVLADGVVVVVFASAVVHIAYGW